MAGGGGQEKFGLEFGWTNGVRSGCYAKRQVLEQTGMDNALCTWYQEYRSTGT